MAQVWLRHFVVDADLDPEAEPDADIDKWEINPKLRSSRHIDVDLAALLEANTMAEREVDRELRYRVLQNELRIILSYLRPADADGLLQLDAENFTATAGHIKRLVSESVGLGMLTAAVQEYFAWEFGPDAISNFDVLPGELKEQFGAGGVRPDLLFDFQDGERMLAGEARGRSRPGPAGDVTRREQLRRMADILGWSRDHGGYPVTMTWAYLDGSGVQVDLFTMSDQSIGGIGYLPLEDTATTVNADMRRQFTAEAIGRRDLRAERLFEDAPPAPAREPRRLFGREVRGNWVTADLVRPSDVRLFLGAIGTSVSATDVHAARSRTRRTAQHPAGEYEAAVSDRLLIVVARSEDPEPAWSRVEAIVEGGESGD